MKREDGHSEINAEKVARGASDFVWSVLGFPKVWRGGHVVEVFCGLSDDDLSRDEDGFAS